MEKGDAYENQDRRGTDDFGDAGLRREYGDDLAVDPRKGEPHRRADGHGDRGRRQNAIVYVAPDGMLYLPDVMQDELTQEVLEPLVGQKVHFRMKESVAQLDRQEQYGDIVAPGTDEQEVFTLEDYNRAMQVDNAQGRLVWLMIEGGLLVLTVYFVWKLRKEKAAREG